MRPKLFSIVLVLSVLHGELNDSYGTYIRTTSTTAASTTTTTAASTTTTTAASTTTTTTTTCAEDSDCGPCQVCNPTSGSCDDICAECQECVEDSCISCETLGKLCCSGICCESCCEDGCCSTTTTTSDTTTTTADTTSTTTSGTTTTTPDTTTTTIATTSTTTTAICTSDNAPGPWYNMLIGTEDDECGNTLTLTLDGVFCYYYNGIKVGNCPYIGPGDNIIGYWKTSDNVRFFMTYYKSQDMCNDGSYKDGGTKYKYDSVIWRYDCINDQGPYKNGIEHPTIIGGDDGTGSDFEETYCPPI